MLTQTKLVVWCITAGAFLSLLASRAAAEPAMWVIRRGDSTIYLLGTVHILRAETEWESEKIKAAVNDSTELWLEVADQNEKEAAALLSKYGVDPARPLSKLLDARAYERLTKIAATYAVPAGFVEPMKPWLAAMTLSLLPMVKAGYNPTAGVEEVLKSQARAEGDKIKGFETIEEQIHALDSLSEPDQMALLTDTLNDVEKGPEYLDHLTNAWTAGDTSALEKALVTDMKRDAPAVYQQLFVNRNIRWSHKIAERLQQPGVETVAVGAAHLVGLDSVQVQLAKQGIDAERR